MVTDQENDPTCLSHSIARCIIHNFFKLYYTPWLIEWITMLNTGSTNGNVPLDVSYTYDELSGRSDISAEEKQKRFDEAGYLKMCMYLFIYFTCTEYYKVTKTAPTMKSLKDIIPHIEKCIKNDILPENLLKHGKIITDFINGRVVVIHEKESKFDKSSFTTKNCWVEELGTIEEFVDRAMSPYPDTYFGIQIGDNIFNRGEPSAHAIVVSNYDSGNNTVVIRNSWGEMPYVQPIWKIKMSCWSPTFCTLKKWGFLHNAFYIGPDKILYRKSLQGPSTCGILGTCALVGLGVGAYYALNSGGTKKQKTKKSKTKKSKTKNQKIKNK